MGNDIDSAVIILHSIFLGEEFQIPYQPILSDSIRVYADRKITPNRMVGVISLKNETPFTINSLEEDLILPIGITTTNPTNINSFIVDIELENSNTNDLILNSVELNQNIDNCECQFEVLEQNENQISLFVNVLNDNNLGCFNNNVDGLLELQVNRTQEQESTNSIHINIRDIDSKSNCLFPANETTLEVFLPKIVNIADLNDAPTVDIT